MLIDDTQETEQVLADLSGIVVAVYHRAPIDTSLARINAVYPEIGCGITEFTEFDHRKQSPVKTTQTDAEGSYSVGDLPSGSYNCVFIKEDWSLRYALNINVMGGKEPTSVNVTLYPTIEFSGHVSVNTVFKENHHYMFLETTNFIAPVILESGTILSLRPGTSINFYNSVTSTGSNDMEGGWIITSSSGLYEYGTNLINSLQRANNVIFYASLPALAYGKATWLNSGLCFRGAQSKINNIRLSDNVESIAIFESDTIIENTTITDNGFTAISGMSNALPISLSKSIIIGATTAIEPLTSGSFYIFDNYFMNNVIAINTRYNYGEIQHNNFDQNKQDIKLSTSTAIISKNNFYHSQILTIALSGQSIPIHDNNFYTTDGYFFNIRKVDGASGTYSTVNSDLDATGNYWFPSNVGEYILDAGDNHLYPNKPCAYYVLTAPSMNRPIIGAGIRN